MVLLTIVVWVVCAAAFFFVMPFILRAIAPLIWWISSMITRPIAAEDHMDPITAAIHTRTGTNFMQMLVGIALSWTVAIWLARHLPVYAWPLWLLALLNSAHLWYGASQGPHYRG